METFAHVLIISAGPLATALFFTFNAMKVNAQWRERRAAKLAARV